LEPLGGTQINSLNTILDQLDLAENEPDLLSASHYFETASLSEKLKCAQKPFSLLSLNVQSIHAKIDELRLLLRSLSPSEQLIDVLCLQETWMSKNDDASQIQLEGYSCLLQGKSISAHGGLAFYVRDGLIAEPFSVTTQTSKLWESFFIKIKLNGWARPLIIGNAYRLPISTSVSITSFIQEFDKTLDLLNQTNCECVIAGDFNINLLKLGERPILFDFIQSMQSQAFFPKITFPTRFGNRSATLIDNILCKLSVGYSRTTAGILTNKLSDHQACFVCLNYLNATTTNEKFITLTKRSDNFFDTIKAEIQNADLMSKIDSNPTANPNYNIRVLHESIAAAIEKHTSTKIVKFDKHKHKKSDWITNGILISIKFRDRMHLRLKRTNHDSPDFERIKLNLNTYNKILKKAIRKAKYLHLHKVLRFLFKRELIFCHVNFGSFSQFPKTLCR
jgi:hypothetical protein